MMRPGWHLASFCALLVMLLTVGTAAPLRGVEIEWVTVGNAGNAPDTRHDPIGFGGVPYVYRIGKYEVTKGQYREFLNAKAAVGDPHGLYNSEMTSETGGIDRIGAGTPEDPWHYIPLGNDPSWDHTPVNFASFWDAIRMINWLHNGQGNGDTETGAYVGLDDESTFARTPEARVFMPTENEWYKAAYYDPELNDIGGYWEYPTRSNNRPSNDPAPGSNLVDGSANYGGPGLTPVGAYNAKPSTSAYGTYDQGGNLWEWNETFVHDIFFGLRGGSFDNIFGLDAEHQDSYPAFFENRIMGFRLAAVAVPEPNAAIIVGIALSIAAGIRFTRQRFAPRSR